MPKNSCPYCRREYTYTDPRDHAPFPFCSERCRWLDLKNWLDGQYRIAGKPMGDGERADDEAATSPEDGLPPDAQ